MQQFCLKKTAGAFLAGVLLLLAGCGSASSGDGSTGGSVSENGSLSQNGSSAEQQKTLVYGSGDYTAINPALYEHGEINSLLFSGLTAHDGSNKVVPGLAESWAYDKETGAYTFRLRQGVNWHDGEPFTAEDVKFTLEAIMNPENLSEIASNYEDITAVETEGPHTVRLVMKAPNVAMLDYLTVGMLPKHLLEGKNLATDPFNQQPVGTGPYRLAAWDMGQSIRMEKNKDYFGGAPEIDSVIFKIVPDEKARALQFKSGELDLTQITPQDAAAFAKEENSTVYIMKTADYRGILYNFQNPLFRDHRELPKALSYAVDRQSIVDSVLLGNGTPAWSPLQTGPYCAPDMEKYDYNPERAGALLEEGGWKIGIDGIREKDGIPLAFTINVGEGDPVRVDMANICAQQLKAVGAEVKVAIQSNVDWGGQEAYLIGWGSPFDPDDHTYKVFGTGKGGNYSGYSNAAVDAALQKARETDVDADRRTYYREFQTALAEDPAFTFLAYADAVYAVKNKVKGIRPDMVLGHHGVGIFQNITEWSIES